MEESIIKLNDKFIKKVQAVFDKYNINFDYIKHLKDMADGCITMSDWQGDFYDSSIKFKDIKDCKKYKPLKIKSDEEFIGIDDGTVECIWFPSLSEYGTIDFDDSHSIKSVKEFDEELGKFFNVLDGYLNLHNMKEYQNIIKNVKEKQKELEEKEKECESFVDKSFKEIERLKQINCDFTPQKSSKKG